MQWMLMSVIWQWMPSTASPPTRDEQHEMGAVPGLIRSLVAVITSKANGKPETAQLAGRTLGMLANTEVSARAELELLKGPIIHAAYQHQVMAEVLWAIFLVGSPKEQVVPPTEDMSVT